MNRHDYFEKLIKLYEQVDNLNKLGIDPNRTLLRMIEDTERIIDDMREKEETNDI